MLRALRSGVRIGRREFASWEREYYSGALQVDSSFYGVFMSSKPSETIAAIDPQQDWSAYVADFRRAAHEAVDWVAEYLADTRRYPVMAKTKPGDLVDTLPSSGPDK